MHIFVDSSVNIKLKNGIGCYLFLDDLNNDFKLEDIKSILIENTSSTMAELETIKYILELLENLYKNSDTFPKIYLYTDCMNFVNLINERKNKEKLKLNKNYVLYDYLIKLTETYNIIIIWTKGHSKQIIKTEKYEKIFSIVDKFARKLSRKLN